ncbi:hypothetical protein ACTFIW_001002 [Dictyostelium discoideum]
MLETQIYFKVKQFIFSSLINSLSEFNLLGRLSMLTVSFVYSYLTLFDKRLIPIHNSVINVEDSNIPWNWDDVEPTKKQIFYSTDDLKRHIEEIVLSYRHNSENILRGNNLKISRHIGSHYLRIVYVFNPPTPVNLSDSLTKTRITISNIKKINCIPFIITAIHGNNVTLDLVGYPKKHNMFNKDEIVKLY